MVSVTILNTNNINAAWDPTDNFDSYADGDLDSNNGGTGWSGAWSAGAAIDIANAPAGGQGGKAVTSVSQAGGNNVDRSITTKVTDGTLSFQIYITSATPSANLYINWLDGATKKIQIRITKTGGALQANNNTTWTDILGSAISANTWYTIKIRFDAATELFYTTVNAGVESAAFTVVGGTFTGIDNFNLNPDDTIDRFYFDDIKNGETVPAGGEDIIVPIWFFNEV